MALLLCSRAGISLQQLKTPNSRPTTLHVPFPALGDSFGSAGWRLLSKGGWLWTRLGTDTLLLLAAILAARFGAPSDVGNHGEVAVWLLLPGVLVLFALRGLYSNAIESRTIDTAGRIMSVTSLASISIIAAAALFDTQAEPAPMLARGWLFATVYLIGGRILLNAIMGRARAAGIAA